jgi:hypothetical protein
MDPVISPAKPQWNRARPLGGIAFWIGLTLAVFGAKLALIGFAGGDVPFMDQWNGEGESVVLPWLEHRLDFHSLARPHNEHRLITTRLFALGLFVANGQWDGLVEMVASAIVATLGVLVLLQLGWGWLHGGWLAGYAVLSLLLAAIPFAWENTLSGFQVQFYFLLLFSTGHLLLALRAERFGGGWLLAQLAGMLAAATMGSGFFSSAAVLAGLGWRHPNPRRWTLAQAGTAFVCLAVISVGWATRTVVPGHAPLQAHGAAQFLGSLWEVLCWPAPVWLPLTLLPGVLFLSFRLRAGTWRSVDPTLVALLTWFLLNAAALAYVRGGQDTALSSRYLDLWALHPLLGTVLLFLALPGRGRAGVGILWMLALVGCLTLAGWRQRPAILQFREHRLVQEAHLRRFLLSGDASELRHKTWPEISYPDANYMLELMRSDALRAVFPPSVRRPLPLQADTAAARVVPESLLPAPSPVAFSTFSAGGDSVIWRSSPQPDRSARTLRFRVAGDLTAAPELRLLVCTNDARISVEPEVRPGLRWRNVTIVRPGGGWWIEVHDSTPAGWLAFTEPVELGRLRRAAERLVKYAWGVLGLGIVLTAAGLLSASGRRDQVRETRS